MSQTVIWMTPGLAQATDIAGHPVWLGRTEQAAEAMTFEQAVSGVHGNVTLVLAAGDVLCAEASLSKQQARHLRKILPFVLEDQLALPVEQQLIIAGPARDQRYPLAVMDQSVLEALLAWLRQYPHVMVEAISVDLWLLADHEASHYQQGEWVLIREAGFSGLWIDQQQQAAYAAVTGEASVATESVPLLPALQSQAARAAQLNFVQGGYARKTSLLQQLSIPPAWQRLGIGLAAVLLLWVGSLYVFGWFYQRAAQDAWQTASNTYNRLFPEDVATPMLESQFRRRLASLQPGQAQQDIFSSLAMVENSFDPQTSGWVAKRLSYDERDHILNLDIEAKQYEQLAQLQKQLAEQGASADIANYRSQGDVVSARIRLGAGGMP